MTDSNYFMAYSVLQENTSYIELKGQYYTVRLEQSQKTSVRILGPAFCTLDNFAFPHSHQKDTLGLREEKRPSVINKIRKIEKLFNANETGKNMKIMLITAEKEMSLSLLIQHFRCKRARLLIDIFLYRHLDEV